MDDGVPARGRNLGLSLDTNNYTLAEVQLLANVLATKYNLKTSVQPANAINQYRVYIFKSSMPLLCSIVLKHMHPSMHYKLAGR